MRQGLSCLILAAVCMSAMAQASRAQESPSPTGKTYFVLYTGDMEGFDIWRFGEDGSFVALILLGPGNWSDDFTGSWVSLWSGTTGSPGLLGSQFNGATFRADGRILAASVTLWLDPFIYAFDVLGIDISP